MAAPGWELAAYLLAGLVAAVGRHMVGALAVGMAALVLAAFLRPQ